MVDYLFGLPQHCQLFIPNDGIITAEVTGNLRRRIQSTILMDVFFGLVIVANGVMMGLTTQGVVDESSEEAQIFEIVPR